MNASLVLIVMFLPKMLVLTGGGVDGLESDTLEYNTHFSPSALKDSSQRRATGTNKTLNLAVCMLMLFGFVLLD